MSYFETLGVNIETAGYRLMRVRLLVPDTNVLLNDVVRLTRTGEPTALVALGELGAVRLYAPHHVRDEIAEHLRTFARARGVSPDAAQATWEARYLTVVRWVDVSSVPVIDPRLGMLSLRDSDDVPTAKLALLLGVASLSMDHDLVAIDLASGIEWLRIVLGARTLTYTELGGAVSLQLGSFLLDEMLSALGRIEHRDLAKGLLVGMAVAGALALLLHVSGEGGEIRRRVGAAGADLVDLMQDIFGRILDARDEAAAHVRRIELAEVVPLSDTHRLARVLASAFEPLSVEALLELLPDLTAPKIDQLLQSNGAFARAIDGRWELGQRDVALHVEPFDNQRAWSLESGRAISLRVPAEPLHLKAAILNPPVSLSRDRFVGTAGARLSSYLWGVMKAENVGWTWQSVQRATRLNRFAFVKWAEGDKAWSSAFASFADQLQL